MNSRPYGDDARDLPLLIAFIQQANQELAPVPWDFQTGDLLWQRYIQDDTTSRWFERVQVWEESNGNILAFAIYYIDTNEVCPLVHPDHWYDRQLLESILAWADEREQALHPDASSPRLSATVTAGSGLDHAFRQLGWSEAEDPPLILYDRSLQSLPAPTPPEGFTIRSLQGSREFQQRVEIHQEAFESTKLTLSSYQHLRYADIEGYDSELDLVAVSPEGIFASYCTLWHDPVNHTGFFEPVGAREAFRGQGLTKATLLEGMQRLKRLRGSNVMVICESDNKPATSLYRSVGFEEALKIVYMRHDGPHAQIA